MPTPFTTRRTAKYNSLKTTAGGSELLQVRRPCCRVLVCSEVTSSGTTTTKEDIMRAGTQDTAWTLATAVLPLWRKDWPHATSWKTTMLLKSTTANRRLLTTKKSEDLMLITKQTKPQRRRMVLKNRRVMLVRSNKCSKTSRRGPASLLRKCNYTLWLSRLRMYTPSKHSISSLLLILSKSLSSAKWESRPRQLSLRFGKLVTLIRKRPNSNHHTTLSPVAALIWARNRLQKPATMRDWTWQWVRLLVTPHQTLLWTTNGRSRSSILTQTVLTGARRTASGSIEQKTALRIRKLEQSTMLQCKLQEAQTVKRRTQIGKKLSRASQHLA